MNQRTDLANHLGFYIDLQEGTYNQSLCVGCGVNTETGDEATLSQITAYYCSCETWLLLLYSVTVTQQSVFA